MKTISINLIGEFSKAPQKVKKQPTEVKSDVDYSYKLYSIIAVVLGCIIFATSCLVMLFASYSTQKYEAQLTQAQAKHQAMNNELKDATTDFKNLENEKKTLDVKFLAKKQIDAMYLPWNKVLADISRTVPKDARLTSIEKNATGRNIVGDLPGITVSGTISKAKSPLTQISYFVLNINENPNPNLSLDSANVNAFDYDETSNSYNFKINTLIKTTDKKPLEDQEK